MVKRPITYITNGNKQFVPCDISYNDTNDQNHRLVGGGATSHSRLVRNGLSSFP